MLMEGTSVRTLNPALTRTSIVMDAGVRSFAAWKT